ncbi:MAG: YibE/F family protein [Patescibacteria group bacterium]
MPFIIIRRLLIFFTVLFLSVAQPIGQVFAETTTPDPAPAPTATEDFLADYTPIPDQFYRGTVTNITEEGEHELLGRKAPYQTVEVELKTGPGTGKKVTIDHGSSYSIQASQRVKKGDAVVIGYQEGPAGSQYYIADLYRIPTLIWLALFFIATVAIVSGKRGLKAILGLVFSFAIVMWVIVPQILAGRNPLLVSLVAACLIAAVSLVFAHGRNRRTLIAGVATFITLAVAVILAGLAVAVSHLSGLGSEEAYQLQFGILTNLNYRGLLLGGIIIGVIGVLDDITVAQTTVVAELKEANSRFDFGELFRRGMVVGREHIASLVNTLVLAYAGVSLPLLFLFSVDQTRPAWFLINSEFLSEEIIRTFVGSMTLVLAVPITTALAAWYFAQKRVD